MFSKFNFPFRKKEKEKKLSEIISENYKILSKKDLLYCTDCINGFFNIMGCDNKKYTILVEIDEMLGLNFNVYNNSEFGKEKIDFVGGFGQIKIKNNELTFDLSDIQSQNLKYQNLGFGRMMMEAVLFTLEYYADVNNFVLSKLSGTVGVGSNFKPEKSIKLYRSFDGFNLKTHLVCVNLDVLNLVDRDISYNFINSAI